MFEAIPGAICKTVGDAPPSYNFSYLSYPYAWDVEERKKQEIVFEEYLQSTPATQQQEDYSNFLKREATCLNFDEEDEEVNRLNFKGEIIKERYTPTKPSKREKYYQECLVMARDYCTQFFEEVSVHESDSFYYPTQQTTISGQPYYYIVAKGMV